jgi:hypothetical protein
MNTRISLASLLILVVFSATQSKAASRFHGTIGTGVTVPNEASSNWNPGYQIMGGLVFDFSQVINVSAKLQYDGFTAKHYDTENMHLITEGIDFTLGSHKDDRSLIPITVLGGGLCQSVFTSGGPGAYGTYHVSHTNFFVDGGVGLEINTHHRLNLVILARAIKVFRSGHSTSFIPITFALKFP